MIGSGDAHPGMSSIDRVDDTPHAHPRGSEPDRFDHIDNCDQNDQIDRSE